MTWKVKGTPINSEMRILNMCVCPRVCVIYRKFSTFSLQNMLPTSFLANWKENSFLHNTIDGKQNVLGVMHLK